MPVLRIRAVTPIHVSSTELHRRQQRYDRLSPAGVAVTLIDIGDDDSIPRALESTAEIRRSEELVIAAMMTTDRAEFDLAMPDCVLDPGIGKGLIGPVPFVGISRLAAHFLASTDSTFCAVTRNDAIGAELEAKIDCYGLSTAFRGIRVLGLSVNDIPDDRAWARAIASSVIDLDASAVINGCSAVEVGRNGPGPRIVDPTALALRLVANVRGVGLVN